ncbi:RNA-guided endonuclease InsQ/TnpB family protein [Methanocella conradii]|uniref:RNA-guided endonuclease InsQ/TnpB family protein n=1 Tax=Methanocella conradii TaxID=1175444 RepID=UPI0024B3C63C|nr:transposase [Methanocella conradii]MDI6896920.1 transposase [Methanocella conradii]
MLRSYRYRFYPSTEVRNNITTALNYCRLTYNKLLELYYNGKINTVYDACNYVATLKQQYPELKTVYSKTLQRAGNHLFNNISVLASLKNKGFKTGGLRYKNEYRFRTLEYNQSGFKITENLLELSKIGTVKLILHRPLPEGRIKSILITRTKSGEYYAIFQVETSSITLLQNNSAVGLDMGVKTFCYDSDGNFVDNPKFLAQSLHKIKLLHRKLSRKQRFSQNWLKTRCKLAKLQEYVANQRNNHNHQVSRYYVNNYGIICVEDLSIARMLSRQNRTGKTLRRSISDAGWGDFLSKLAYKAESAGRVLVRVDPRETSQKCYCGNIVKKDLSERVHDCPCCGVSLDRDFNSALNILKKGLELLSGREGREPPGLPVEPAVNRDHQVSKPLA